MKKIIVIAAALTLLFIDLLSAHELWVAKEKGNLVVMFKHDGKSDPYKPEFVKIAKGFDSSGREVAVRVIPQGTRTLLAPAQPPALVSIVYSPGVYCKTPEGYKNISKRDAKDAIESIRAEIFNKNFWQWNDRFAKPLGGKMELVPLKNPLVLKVEDKLPFQVLYDGQPLPGAAVIAEGIEKDSLKADGNGRAEVIIKRDGLNVVKARRKTPTVNDPDADILIEIANISFSVK